MTDSEDIKVISYFQNSNPSAKPWCCHIYTKDRSHYEGEGFTKDQAKENAMGVLLANSQQVGLPFFGNPI
jgi:hypothetical protein